VITLSTSRVAQTKASSFAGIAVVEDASETRAQSGRWEYSTDAGSTWTKIPAVSDENPLLLNPASFLRFLPSSRFSGLPPALTVRLLDDSITIPSSGTQLSGTPLISGGSGSASAEKLKLFGYITPPPPQSPASLSFAFARDILLIPQDSNDPESDLVVAGGTLIGRFVAFDPDSAESQLSYGFQDNTEHTNTNGVLIQDLLEITNGNQLRIRSDASISQADLEALELIVNVTDEGGRSISSPTASPYRVSPAVFTQTPDTLARSESVVLPLIATGGDRPNEPLQFSATGLDGALSVQSVGALSGEDISFAHRSSGCNG